MQEFIEIQGAREHNLQNIDVRLPRDTLTVLTGVSGSGKSSLAYDTLFKEGQRRFIESLSPYARQFLGQMEKPKVDHIEGISPAICIDQKRRGVSSRSTVGTITEIYDHLRLLFARVGVPHCPQCGQKIISQTPDQITKFLSFHYTNQLLYVLAPMIVERKGEYRKELEKWRVDGFVRIRIDGNIHRLDDEIQLKRYEKHTLELVLDRIRIQENSRKRLAEAIEQAVTITGGSVAVLVDDEEHRVFSVHRSCPYCGVSIPEMEPRLFSFNNPQGACSQCKGRGTEGEFDISLLVPDPSLTIEEGALRCVKNDGKIIFSSRGVEDFGKLAEHFDTSLDTPWEKLPQSFCDAILQGISGNPSFPGIIPILQRIYEKWNLHQIRRFLRISPCSQCSGARLKKESLCVLFGGQNIAQLAAMTVDQLWEFIRQSPLGENEAIIAKEIRKELDTRLSFLRQVGLGYLTLDRTANTLAGGEMQRIRLARQLGSGLQGVLYVLDEPSIGLHARDNQRLLKALGDLRDSGNTVVVIEHDEETIRCADHVVDIGPGAGREGGHVVAHGRLTKIKKAKDSLTGQYLRGDLAIGLPEKRRSVGKERIKIVAAEEHNLKKIDVVIPLEMLVVVTGVSGSGKSTLVSDVLQKALARHFHGSTEVPGKHKKILGLKYIDKVIEVDQSPIGRTPRSNPATYTKVFDEIRALFSQLPESKARGYAPGRFSFNVVGGRCEACKGAGVKEIEMQFLSNVLITCETCEGQRFNNETLDIHFRDKNICEVLEMTIAEGLEFFRNVPKIAHTLQTLCDVGLTYLQLGQPSPTLSGGEAQRVKLVRELRRSDTGKTLYILDEPTTGLHFADIQNLLRAINRLVEKGNTVLVIEHNLDVIKMADYVIDLGPEGGEGGGQVIATGTPEQIMECPNSHTGKALSEYLRGIHSTLRRRKSRVHQRDIVISGGVKNNLKNVSATIPKAKMTVVTGVSGSGKTSLAFDTLFAEGQRAFLESLSTYARRFLGRLDHGDVDSIEGLAPAIAIDQKTSSHNPRSTVATMTEIYDYLRILYARAGIAHCPHCGEQLRADTASSAALDVIEKYRGERGYVLAPLYIPSVTKSFALTQAKQFKKLQPALQQEGFQRVLVGGEEYRLDEKIPTDKRVPIHLIIDRIKVSDKSRTRLAEAFETAFERGHDVAFFRCKELPDCYSTLSACVPCDYYQYHELHPRMFSFNHYSGACVYCDGLGYFDDETCVHCQGKRLKPESIAVTIGDLSISDFCLLKVKDARQFLAALELSDTQQIIARDLLKEVETRLKFLVDVGLGYLDLNRRGNTLSGGEAQRIRLACQIGNSLVGVLYVLDEPTIGLHQRDTRQLLDTLRQLVALGNTVVMVEHDPQCIQESDYVLDMGPGAGHLGGEVVAAGSPEEIMNHPQSLTGQYLAHKKRIEFNHQRKRSRRYLKIHQACKHNLKQIDVRFPLECMTIVTGVSGSGKSTLVVDVLQDALEQYWENGQTSITGSENDGFAKISGLKHLDNVVVIDQSPIGRSPNSNLATYSGVFDKIRSFFAQLPGSRSRGFKAGRFSFNRAGGRCENCEGKGAIQVHMHFLSDVWITCEACNGQRYLEETLAVHYQGRNIAQVLEMDVQTALEFFHGHVNIRKRLQVLADVGLGYMKLGQPANTLSGGEAQRIKLAAELGNASIGKTLYLFDEPTTGLHAADVHKLLEVLHRLVDEGNTVIVIEHNLDVIRSADWIIDLGPEGGDGGGQIVFAGTLEEALSCKEGYTGKSLAEYLQEM